MTKKKDDKPVDKLYAEPPYEDLSFNDPEELLIPRTTLPEPNFETTPIDQWRRLSMAHRVCSELLRKSTGLEDVSQPALLAALGIHPDGVADSQKILAEMLHVTPATITVSLRSMQRNGYVVKQVDENDQRRKRIMLTDKGKAASANMKKYVDLLDGDMYRGFTDEERALCSEFFRRMTENLEDSAQGIRKIIRRRQRYAAAIAEREAEAAENKQDEEE